VRRTRDDAPIAAPIDVSAAGVWCGRALATRIAPAPTLDREVP
jgi:hypothetical protein